MVIPQQKNKGTLRCCSDVARQWHVAMTLFDKIKIIDFSCSLGTGKKALLLLGSLSRSWVCL